MLLRGLRRGLAFLAILVVPGALTAQTATGTVRGKVTDAATATGLAAPIAANHPDRRRKYHGIGAANPSPKPANVSSRQPPT